MPILEAIEAGWENLMDAKLVLTDTTIAVYFGPVCHTFPRTCLGVMRAADYVMTFGRPVTFWCGARELGNVSAFLQEAGMV